MAEPVGSASIEVRATVRALRADMAEIKRSVEQNTRAMQQQANRTERGLGKVGAKFRREMALTSASVRAVNSDMASLGRLSTAALAGAGGAAGALAVARLADEYNNLSARIRLVLRDGDDFNDIQDRLFQTAQRNRAAVADLTNLYVRLRQSIAGLGDAEALNIASLLSQTLAISGANATETASFLRQISQALASGVLRGDEFNSVMENNSRFAALLAQQLGVSVGQLRAMAEQGRLTADVIRSSIAGGAGEVVDEFERMPLTIAGAWTQITNAFARYVGQTDQGLGASQRLAEGLSLLAKNFESVADAMILVGGAGAANLFARGSDSLSKSFGAVVAEEWLAAGRARIATEQRLEVIQNNIANATDRRVKAMVELDDLTKEIASTERAAAIQRERLRPNPTAPDGRPIAGPIRPAGDASALARAERQLIDLYARRTDLTYEVEGAERTLRAESQRQIKTTAELARNKSALAQAMRGVSAAGGVAGRSMSGLVNLLGGPLPALITAVSVAFFIMARRQDEARIAAERMGSALSIIANATPAFEGAAVTIGETADETRTLAEVIEDAALGTKDAADQMERYAGKLKGSADATDIQARATRALAAARIEEAKATIRQAIAEGERARLSLPTTIANRESQIANLEAGLRVARREGRSGDGLDGTDSIERRLREARNELQIARDQLRAIETGLPINREGLAALESGLLNLNAPDPAASGGGTITAGAGARSIADLERAAALNLARLRSEMERVAALEDAAEIEQRTDAYVKAGMRDAEARAKSQAEVTAEREEQNRLQAEALELASIQDRLELAREAGMIRTADSLEDQLEIRQRTNALLRDGLSLTEATARAEEYVTARRRIANDNLNREIQDRELERRRDVAEAGGDNSEARRLEREQEWRRRVRELEGQGHSTEGAGGIADAEAAELRRAEIYGDIKQGVGSALVAAVKGEDWQSAFASALESRATEALENAFNSAINLLMELLRNTQLPGSNGGGGFISKAVSVVGSLFGGGRATGGDVAGNKWYMVGEQGPEPFFPGVSGSIGTNQAMREAMGAGGRGVVVNNHFHLNGAVTSAELRTEIAKMGAAATQAARQGAASDRHREAFKRLR